MIRLLCLVLGYFFGAFQTAYFYGKMHGIDIRTKGSGNAGTTNTLRVLGTKAGMIVLAGDVLKTILAITVTRLFILPDFAEPSMEYLLVLYTAAGAILGHNYPFYMQFKGGKGIATSLGVLLITNWQIGLICLVFAIVLMALTKMVSMGSVGAAILYPVLVLFIHTNYTVSEGSGYLIFSIMLAAIVAFNHRANIKRLMNGTENRISFKK